MLNTLESYREAGRQCAIARNQKDEMRARHWSQWATHAGRLETPEDRRTAREEFQSAYRETRTPIAGELL